MKGGLQKSGVQDFKKLGRYNNILLQWVVVQTITGKQTNKKARK